MKILVTGAGGLVGSHCVSLLAARHSLVGRAHRELDICDFDAVRSCLERTEPDAVINCAMAPVDACEREPERARAVNVDGPAVLAEACAARRIQLVHFSSNYVFAGMEQGRAAYTVHDEPAPLNEYGRSKLAGERAVRERLAAYHIVRISWVYGPVHANFLGAIHRELRARRPVRAIADAWANTTYAPDLIERVDELLQRRCYGVHHVVSDGICSREDFAREAARLVGLSAAEATTLIELVSESGAGQQAPRPRWSPLASSTTAATPMPPLRHWREALREHVTLSSL